jgi:hypothetical protein
MHAADLATACQVASGDRVRAVGWLEASQPFPIGHVESRFLERLRSHVADPGRWLATVSAGVHSCDLGGCAGAAGSQYVVIPSHHFVYVAPDLVVHYVEQHAYAPPQQFVDAVLACPEQSSDAYVQLLLPFAPVWKLDADRVRRIAATAPQRRQAHSEAKAQREAAKGSFKW